MKWLKFHFIDEAGDRFLGLRLSLDVVDVSQISPGDQGSIFEEGMPSTFGIKNVEVARALKTPIAYGNHDIDKRFISRHE